MNENIQVSAQVAQAAGTVLDQLMNTPIIQEQMKSWIQLVYPELNIEEALQEENENTLQERFYYAATVEFHSRVLGTAIQGLMNDVNLP